MTEKDHTLVQRVVEEASTAMKPPHVREIERLEARVRALTNVLEKAISPKAQSRCPVCLNFLLHGGQHVDSCEARALLEEKEP